MLVQTVHARLRATARRSPLVRRAHNWWTLLPYRLVGWLRVTTRSTPRRTVLFFPHLPSGAYKIRRICALSGWTLTNDPTGRFDYAVHWQDQTRRDAAPALAQLAERGVVINGRADDISKRRVDELHRAVFGYGVEIDPLSHIGPLVEKSDRNAAHDARILEGPLRACDLDPEKVYQRLMNCSPSPEIYEYIRVPLYLGVIPFCHRCRGREHGRFNHDEDTATTEPAGAVFSRPEIAKIIELASAIGHQAGDIDVLRDYDTGRIYVLDTNVTPMSPMTFVRLPRRIGLLLAIARILEARAPRITV